MAEYLMMRLYGPMASWGEIAVGETRRSSVQPSRSALLGLLGAALGIDRNDESKQQSLADAYRFGVKLEAAGTPLRDYHTIQVGRPPRKVTFRSRRQELMADKIDTMLSSRDYRCDSLAIVAVERVDQAGEELKHLAEALRRPVYPLYLGRKSCPLALPVDPKVAQANGLLNAFQSVQFPSLAEMSRKHEFDKPWPSKGDQWMFRLGQVRYYWEEGMEPGMAASFEAMRTDQPVSRSRWQFERRKEWVALEERQG